MEATDENGVTGSKRFSALTFGVSLIAILLLSSWLRFHRIEIRPLHNDEGVNHHFLQDMDKKGYYPYSHENYHGPSYFYLTKAIVDVIGDSELGLRLSAILIGLLTPLLLLRLRRLEGDLFILFSALLLALSPSTIFYNRYAIHETLFVFAGVWVAVELYRWSRTHERTCLYSGALGLALLVATKETFIITLFCLFFAALCLGDLKARWAKLWEQWHDLTKALVIAALALVFTFTAGFRWAGGMRELILAVPQWLSRNTVDVGHHKPFQYYAKIIFETETYLVLVVVLPVLCCFLFRKQLLQDLRSGRGKFVVFGTAWTLLSLLVYSYVKYKTPWLIMGIVVPGCLVCAWWISWLVSRYGFAPNLGSLLGIVCLVNAGYMGWHYNFKIPFGQRNPFSYVHSSQGMIEVRDLIEKYWKRDPTARVLIGVAQYWPLPYYFRKNKERIGYLHAAEAKNVTPQDADRHAGEYSIMIFDKKVYWERRGWVRRYLRLSDVQESHTYIRTIDKQKKAG